MPTFSQGSTPPTSRQSQIGGWTVLREPPPTSPTNDSDGSDIAEANISPSMKRKAKNVPMSSRSTKSPRISENAVSAGTARPLAHSRNSLGSVGELRSTGHRAGPSSMSSRPRGPARANISVSQPKASGSGSLPEERNSAPSKFLTGIRPLLSSKSVPSLRQGTSSSQPISKSKPVDSDGSSSSESLPDPVALVSSYRSAPTKVGPDVTSGKGKEKASGDSAATQKGSTGASSSSAATQKKLISKSRPSMASDDELIIISSDSDDNARKFTKKPLPRKPRPSKAKEPGSKKFLVNADGAIDLTSDTDMPPVAKSQPVKGSQAKSTEGEKAVQKKRITSSGVETALFPSSTTLGSGGVSPAAAGPSHKTNQSQPVARLPAAPRPVFTLPLPSNSLGIEDDRPEDANVQTSRSAPIPLNAPSLGSSPFLTGPADSGIKASSSARIARPSTEKNILEASQPSDHISGASRSSEPHETVSKASQIGKTHAPPPAGAEVIDLCSDSDEAMEVDDLLILDSERQDLGTSRATIPFVSGNQDKGKALADPRIYTLPLPQPSSQPSPSQSRPLAKSSSLELIKQTPDGRTSRADNIPTSVSQAVSSVDDHFDDGPSSSLPSIIGARLQRLVPASSSLAASPPHGIPLSSSISSQSSTLEGATSKETAGEVSGSAKISPSSDSVDVFQRRNASAGPSRLPATSTTARTLSKRTYKTSTNTAEDSVSSDDMVVQDSAEALVAPVSDMHLQNSDHDQSPDPLDTIFAGDESMNVDMPPGSVSRKSTSERPSLVSSSPLQKSSSPQSESSGPSIQHARKTTGNRSGTDRSESGIQSSDLSERDDAEMQEQDNEPLPVTPSRNVISVKEPDFSKLRADNPNALDDPGSLSDAIQWPAEKIPTELHDMLNHLPVNYHHNPQMKYIFESMIEENTAEDEPTSPRIEISSNQNGPVCPPWEFYYTNRILYGRGVPRSDKKLLKGCDCDGPCDPNSETCACVRRQRGWTGDDKSVKGFLYNKKGKILNPGYPIFECNDSCECSEECMNRVIQNGRQHQISICLTKGKGWGVYADEKIPRGTYLGIYSGEMLLESEAAERGKLYDKYGRTYLFDLDFYYLHSLEADKQKASASKRDDAPSASQVSAADKDEEKSNLYTIDAFHVGNFTRFLNHSCDPNCVITPSYVNEPDLQKPTLTIFTTRDVKKGEELCFSYFGNVDDDDDDEDQVDEHGQTKKVVGGPGTHTTKAIHRPCLCGAPNCRGKMF